MLYKKYSLFLVLLIVALCFNCVTAAKKKLTPEQKAQRDKLRAERKKKSDAADKLIRHTSADDFPSTVLEDNEHLWIVFYGSRKCPHTQKFNPKWLQFQQNMDSGLYDFDNIKITKIECYGEQLDFCVDQDNQFWPELMFYYQGKRKATYDGEDEIEDIVKYIKKHKDKFMKDGKKTTKTAQQKSGLPSKKPTKQPPKEIPNKPTKTPPPTKQPPQSAKQPPKVEENNVDNSIDNDVENNIEEDVENAIDENEDNNENIDNENVNTENVEDTGSSHIGVYSVGGLAACVLGFVFAKKRFRGHGYTRVGGNDRPQMKYKYDKHIV